MRLSFEFYNSDEPFRRRSIDLPTGQEVVNELRNSQVLVTSRTAWGRISGETPSPLNIVRRKTSTEGANPLI